MMAAMIISLYDYKYWSIAMCVTSIKLLLMPSYHSTDFEVHRNWLSITYNLPLSQWYYESTSEWTLDYPPLFAWFEFGLSQIAYYFDENMLKISKNGYISDKTIIFQRLTVIISDLFYFYGALEWCKIINKLKTRTSKQYIYDQWFHPNVILGMLFLWNPGLLIVDHIHFQYNGILSGLMLLSMARMVQKRELESAFWFAILLNMKHIYIYITPAYFVYLLRNYCFDRHLNFKVKNFGKLALIVSSVFIVSFGPFIALGQINQIISRLFPFKRGLSHAYWAPNFWALYNGFDKALSLVLKNSKSNASMTSGLVQQYQHEVLLNITPIVTLLCVLLAIVPSLMLLWKRSHQSSSQMLFIRCVIVCAFSSYTFGWHVHEKAIILITLPLTPLAMISKVDAKLFIMVSVVGNFSLFPLLYKEAETLTKILLLLIYCVYSFKSLEIHHKNAIRHKFDRKFYFQLPLMNITESIYLVCLTALQLFYSTCNMFTICNRYPFMPLMLISIYCSLGLIYSFVEFYINLYSKGF